MNDFEKLIEKLKQEKIEYDQFYNDDEKCFSISFYFGSEDFFADFDKKKNFIRGKNWGVACYHAFNNFDDFLQRIENKLNFLEIFRIKKEKETK